VQRKGNHLILVDPTVPDWEKEALEAIKRAVAAEERDVERERQKQKERDES